MTAQADPLPAGNPQPPLLDLARRRLILPRHLVPVGLLLLERQRIPDAPHVVPGLGELERAGIVNRGELHPVARDILRPIASPAVVVSIEIAGSGPLVIATIWRSGSRATLGMSPDRATFELYPVEPDLVPFHLAALTGAGKRPTTGRQPITIGSELLAESVCVAAVDPEDARALLQSGGLEQETAARIVQLHAASAKRWRVSTLWCEPDGFIGDRALEVIDGGPLGYWEVTGIAKDRTVVLTPRSLDSVLRLFADALPND